MSNTGYIKENFQKGVSYAWLRVHFEVIFAIKPEIYYKKY